MDDVIVSRDAKNWLVVCNASNREKLVRHFNDVRHASGMDFDMADQTEGTAMVAIQGPKVIDGIGGHAAGRYQAMKRYHFDTDSTDAGQVHGLPQRIHRRRRRGDHPAGEAAAMAMKMLGGKIGQARCDDQTRRAGGARHAATRSGHAAVWP